MAITDVRISAGTDDVEERTLGSLDFNSSDLELVDDGTKRPDQTIGLRFNGLNIPPGAAITNAYKAEIDRLQSDLLGISDELATARGTYTGALMNYNAQRQFTSEASFNSGNARTPDERDTWKLRHKEEVDKEARLYANLQSATDNMDRLVDAEKEILGAIARQTDEAIRKSSESELENEDAEDQGPEAIARRVSMRRKELAVTGFAM